MRSLTLEARAPIDKLRAALSALESALRAPPTIQPIGSDGVVRARLEVQGSDLDHTAERAFRAVADAGIDLRELKREDTSLEDVFARLTTQEGAADEADAGEDSAPPRARASAPGSEEVAP